MKKTILIIIFMIMSISCYGADYYVSESTGNNSNNGTSTSTPFKTCDAIDGTGFLSAGDHVYFKRGDEWKGAEATCTINSSGSVGNPIIIETYGDGDKPLFTGAITDVDLGESWNLLTGSIYYINNFNFDPNEVVIEDGGYVLVPKSPSGSMIEGSNYYKAATNQMFVWASDSGNPSTHSYHFSKSATWTIKGDYVDIHDLKARFSNSAGFLFYGDHNRIFNSHAEKNALAGFYWHKHAGNGASADYGYGQGLYGFRNAIESSQDFTVEGDHTWIVDSWSDHSYQAGFDWLDYSSATSASYGGCINCIASYPSRSGGYDAGFYVDGGNNLYFINCISHGNGNLSINGKEQANDFTIATTNPNHYVDGFTISNEHPGQPSINDGLHHIYFINILSYDNKGNSLEIQTDYNNVFTGADEIYVLNSTLIRGSGSLDNVNLSGRGTTGEDSDLYIYNTIIAPSFTLTAYGQYELPGYYHGDYNVFWRGAADHATLFTVDRDNNGSYDATSFLEWKAFTGEDANSIESNPNFEDSGETYGQYYLNQSTSSALNRGSEGKYWEIINAVKKHLPVPIGLGTTRTDKVLDDIGDMDAGFHYPQGYFKGRIGFSGGFQI